MQLKYNQEEFQQLIASSSAYMSKIETYSNALNYYPFSEQLLCLQTCLNILEDQSVPIIKKLFVFRFIKDTIILASLSFYECVVIKIFPWLIRFSVCFKIVGDETKVAEAGKILRGAKSLPVAEISVCKNLVNLIEDILKWTGTYIQNHPYSQIQFRSAFRLLLQKHPQVNSKKLNELTFFKPEDPNRYQAHYLQKATSESEGEKLTEYIKNQLDLAQKFGDSETLPLLLQTGDQFSINCLIEQLQSKLEEIDKRKAETGLHLLKVANRLFLLGEMHFCNQFKNQLLCCVLAFGLMLHQLKIKQNDQLAASKVVSYLMKWQKKCVELKMPCESIKLAINRLKSEGVQPDKTIQNQSNPKIILNFMTEINKDKISHIDLNQNDLLLKVKDCKQIQPLSSDHIVEQQEKIYKNSMDQPSHSSIKSYNKKSNFLQAYSKLPPNNPVMSKKNNMSEVKEIYFQHSNLSQRFHQFQQNTPQDSNANHLLMSFKVSSPHFAENSRSPQLIFSDSFTSNQKNSPTKQSKKYDQNIQVIYEPSNTIQNSSISKKSSGGIQSQKLEIKKSYDRQVNDLKQQSNKRELSKMSEVSDYYKEQKKQSANYAQRQPIQSQKQHIIQYILQKKGSQEDSVRRSKHSDERQQNCIYLVRSADRRINKITAKKEGSLSSRGEKSKRIKGINFNEVQKNCRIGQQQKSTHQMRIQVEVIRVEKTIIKPRFAFNCQEDQNINLETAELQAQEINITDKQQSISFQPSINLENQQKFKQIPENFKDVLQCRKELLKINQFDYKARQLQTKIEKIKQKKAKIEREVKLKSLEIQKIKEQLPTPVSALEQQNKTLLKALKIKKQKALENTYNKKDLKCAILHVSATPIKEQIKKQILYLKCRLFHDENLEIGQQVKDKELTLYFTFLNFMDQCSIKVEENSLKLSQSIEAKMYKVLQSKQIKFKTKIQNYVLFENSFEFATLRVDLKFGKNSKTQLISIPYHLYNEFLFHSPTHQLKNNKSTDWHFSCRSLRQNRYYLQDFLPKGKFMEEKYCSSIELREQRFNYQIVLEGQKFAIKYEDRPQRQQLAILVTLISLFEEDRVFA